MADDSDESDSFDDDADCDNDLGPAPAPPAKRAWNAMRSGWGKRDAALLEPTAPFPQPPPPPKRRWSALNGAFGKRSLAPVASDRNGDEVNDGGDEGGDDDGDGGGAQRQKQRNYTGGEANLVEATDGPSSKRGWRQLNGAYGKRVGECARSKRPILWPKLNRSKRKGRNVV